MSRNERNKILLAMAEAGAFDFVDFGTHKGSGLRFGSDLLGGRQGLGVELNDAKVVENLAAGLHVYSGDVNAIPLDGKRFKFGVCRHVLEHMPNADTVASVLASLARMCSDFIYIEQPDATHEAYLNSLGLMSMAATLSYHTCLMTETELAQTLERAGLANYQIGHRIPQRDSANKWIHAIGSPPNRWAWTETDLPKPHTKFDRIVYRDIVFVAGLREDLDMDATIRRVPGTTVRGQ